MLTDKEVRAAEKRPRAYRMADGQGLHLQVMPNGSKLWRYRYEFPAGREKMLALGKYPGVGLAAARKAREAARKLLDEGKDPSVEKRVARAATVEASDATFETFGRAWIQREAIRWVPKHKDIALSSLERDAFPALGRLPITRITAPMVLGVLRKVEARGAVDAARRLRQRMSSIFVFAIAAGVGVTDPATIVAGALARRVKGRQPAADTIEDARAVLAAVEAEGAQPVTHLAHRFLALTSVRQNEMADAHWSEMHGLDGPEPLWRIPKERMKGQVEARRAHTVPLSRQAVEVLTAVRVLNGGHGRVFKHAWEPARGMSTATLVKLLKQAGQQGKHVPHGWRAAFSTIMNRRHPNKQDREVIDLMLAHVPGNAVEAAYNREAYMPRRREIAQEWADLLLEGKGGAEGLPSLDRAMAPSPAPEQAA